MATELLLIVISLLSGSGKEQYDPDRVVDATSFS
jgi:hypothetical protein